MSDLFGWIATATIIVVYILYMRSVIKAEVVPNPATWLIWSVVNVMNAFTYFTVTHGSIGKTLITVVISALVICLFFYAVLRGRMGRVGMLEIFSVVLALGVGVIWKMTGNVRLANIMLQVIFAVSYVPTILGLVRGTGREKPLPWMLAALAFAFSTLGALTNFTGDWVELAYPLVNGILGNGTVAVIATLKNRAPLLS